MRKYYTRPCNFYYGNYSKKLVKLKKTLPLAGNNNISFDQSINDLLESAAELNFSEILPDYILSGEIFNLGIIVTNTSGHNLPTGTTFSRQIWLELNVLADLDTIYRSGHLDSNGDLYDFYIDPQRLEDPDLTIFRTILYDANGEKMRI